MRSVASAMKDKARVIGASGGALGLGGLAAALSLCCSVPWAVALLGVTGAVTFARLAFLFPYAVIGAVALLGVGFWLAYRPVACAGGVCTPTSRRSLRWIVWIATALVAVLSIAALSMRAEAAEVPKVTYTILDKNDTRLREDFNRDKGSVRLLLVVDPTCPVCLRGLDDVNKALLAKTRDVRLQTFVVHLPVLKPTAQASDVPPAAELLQNPHVRHYWNPSGSFGHSLTEGVKLQRDGKSVYAWDVWLLYGPDASWDDVNPPKPYLLMHQLPPLKDTAFPILDGEEFAQQARQLLARLPARTATK